MRIWDLHTHFASTGLTAEQRAEKLLRVADRMGIERLCLYMGFPWSQDPAPDKFRAENDQVLSVLPKWPDRLLGFVYLNPKHVEESLAELDRCVKDGPMVGVKLWVAQHCNTPEVDRLVERAHELQALVFQHTWLKVMANYPGESTPLDFAELAQRHSGMPLVCGHTGGDWEQGIRAIAPLKNTFADLAGSDPVAGYTEMAVRELGAGRVLYGSDASGRSFASQLAKVHGADIPAEAKKLIFGENLIRLLTPILKAKGIKF
ncbi:MAG: amidohydrolase family protein [Chthoniobacter sp.]|uniref:amidohydrolase family protein n=1 Tax=Chthoniobacter sp. TaxID=2510640 RepID=UPI0032AD327D